MSAQHTQGPWLLKTYKSFGGAADVLDRLVDANDRTIRFDGVSLSSGKEPGANTRLISVAPEMLAAIEAEYMWLANIQHNWAGRDTAAGQQRLCRLRDLICKATGRDPQDVQDDYSNRSAGVGA